MLNTRKSPTHVIDIFAGPGGLGEGFSGYERPDGTQPFKLSVSIEKDQHAYQTLRLRSFFRQFNRDDVPDEFYRILRGELSETTLRESVQSFHPDVAEAWKRAEQETLHAELGVDEYETSDIRRTILGSLDDADDPWVLIGGPPCQAYSVVGRSRNRGIKNYSLENDSRHGLYREYLKIIADMWPAVFVMENVKGMLSATVQQQKIFDRILEDLHDPASAVTSVSQKGKASQRHRYQILSVASRPEVDDQLFDVIHPSDFIVKSEDYGIPQERHRVILIGVREDFRGGLLNSLVPSPSPTVRDVIGRLPRIRSGLSRTRKAQLRYTECLIEHSN